jgi:Fe-S-cluster-containing dehydrogenase component
MVHPNGTHQCIGCVLCRHLCILAAAAASIRASLAARGHQTLSKVKSVYQILSCSQLILSGLQLFSCVEGSKFVAAHILCRTGQRQATHPEAAACHAMCKHALRVGRAVLARHQLQRHNHADNQSQTSRAE